MGYRVIPVPFKPTQRELEKTIEECNGIIDATIEHSGCTQYLIVRES